VRLTQVMMEIRDSIARSEEVRAFCLDRFGREPTVMAGYNARRPPGNDELPAIVVAPDRSDFDGVGRGEHKIDLMWAVLNDGGEERDGNKITFPGFLQVDELGELVLSSLEAVGSEYRITYTGYDLFSSDQSPAFVGEMELTVTEW